MNKDRLKQITNQYVTRQVIKASIEYGAKILIKMIDANYFHFLGLYNIKFESKKEEREFYNYLKKEYLKNIRR